MRKLVCLSLVAALAGCGGGGDQGDLSQGGTASGSNLAAQSANNSSVGNTASAGFSPSTQRPAGIALKDIVITQARPTAQFDEYAQPDTLGQYDSLIPVADDYPIPEVPSRLFDIATMREGQFLRPKVPTFRTTVDGRLGVGMTSYVGKRLDNNLLRAISFALYTPEKLAEKNVHVSQASDGSTDMMASDVWWVPEASVIDFEKSKLRTQMFAVCDSTLAQLDKELYEFGPGGIQRNPYPVNDTDEAYDIHLISGNRDDQSQIFSIPLRVTVANAKTPQAQISKIESLGEPIVATFPFTPIDMFEPTITGDGRLLVFRTSGTPGQGGGAESLEPKPWTDNQGKTTYSQFDMVYAYNSPGSGYAPCDPRGWSNIRPITYAHHDTPVRERYGFAKFPFRDPEGKVMAAGQESGMTYPWIDSKGANLFFTGIYRMKVMDETSYLTNEDFEMMQSLDATFDSLPADLSNTFQQTGQSAPQLRPNLMLPAKHSIPVPGTCSGACTDSSAREHVSSTRGVGVAGLWTEGKMVLLDGLLNATDFGYQAFDSSQRLLKLYHGQGGVVQVGNGRTNTDNLSLEMFIDPYWPLNDSMSETHENKFNFFSQWRPASPKDVTWTVSTGRASTEVSFDDYMDPAAVVLSNMQASMSHNPLGPIKWLKPNTGDRADRPLRLQNAATLASPAIPPFGNLVGQTKLGTRIEPVALGGIEGKGLWLNERSGAAYTVGQLPTPSTTVARGAYYGVFVDPRADSEVAGFREVLGTPTGFVGLTKSDNDELTLVISDKRGQAPVLQTVLPADVKLGQYFHVGINRTVDALSVYINGFLWREITGLSQSNLLHLAPGTLSLGGDTNRLGQRGWYDNFEVFNRPLIDAEEACVRAMGSLVKTNAQGAMAEYPAESHKRIAAAIGMNAGQQFECHRNYAVEGWAFLTQVPKSDRVGSMVRQIKPLLFGQPRPAETDNAFCVSCHRTPHPSQTMSLEALQAQGLPAQLDRRRQPLQPNAAVVGVVPKGWERLLDGGSSGSKSAFFEKEGEYLLIDEVLLK